MASLQPYEGAPELALRDIPTPPLNVSARPEAFGVDVAGAISHLGQVGEGAGKEIAERGFAMQMLHEDAAADAALAHWQDQKLIPSYLDQISKEGKNAVDGLPGFTKSTEDSRNAAAGELNSPYARFKFNEQSRRSRWQTVFSAGLHANEENKKYQVASAQAVIKSTQDLSSIDPKDDKAFDASLATIRQKSNEIDDIHQLAADDPLRKLHSDNAVSDAILQRVDTIRRNDPQGAKHILDKAIDDHTVHGDKVAQIAARVDQDVVTIGSRVNSSQIMSGADPRLGAGQITQQQAMTGLKSAEGGYYGFKGEDVTTKDGLTGHPLGHYGIMSYNLAPWLKEAGMSAMSEEQFLKDPEAQDKLAWFKFDQYQKKFGSANLAAKAWLGGEGSINIPDEKLHDKNMNFAQYRHNFGQGLATGADEKTLVAAGRKRAEDTDPGNILLADETQRRIETQYAENERIKRDTENQNTQTVADAMLKPMPNGLLPTSIEDLKSDPKVAEAFDELWATKKESFTKQLMANALDPVPLTPDRAKKFQTIRGMASDPEQQNEFLKVDALTLDLPLKEKRQIMSLQRDVLKQKEMMVPIQTAMAVIAPKLSAMGITRRDDEDGYNHFRGLYTDVLMDFENTNKRKPNSEEMEDLGNRLLQDHAIGQRSLFHPFGGGTEPWFKQQIPDTPEAAKTVEMIKADYAKRGETPSDDDLRQTYLRLQFREIMDSGKAKKPNGRPD